jgi:hypothetical protein
MYMKETIAVSVIKTHKRVVSLRKDARENSDCNRDDAREGVRERERTTRQISRGQPEKGQPNKDQ